tara:strand:+ start:110 stop:271 length:162 start_codon:yes stop_codon:yes gene_type:complete
MKKTYVIWKGPKNALLQKEFNTKESAYNFMLEKLSSGVWACISQNKSGLINGS